MFLIIQLAPRAGMMNQISCCDWLLERARWSYLACYNIRLFRLIVICSDCAMTIYRVTCDPNKVLISSCTWSCTQLATLPTQYTGYVPQGTFIMLWCFIPYNKSFIDQTCSVKMAGYWPHSYFACLWT